MIYVFYTLRVELKLITIEFRISYGTSVTYMYRRLDRIVNDFIGVHLRKKVQHYNTRERPASLYVVTILQVRDTIAQCGLLLYF